MPKDELMHGSMAIEVKELGLWSENASMNGMAACNYEITTRFVFKIGARQAHRQIGILLEWNGCLQRTG